MVLGAVLVLLGVAAGAFVLGRHSEPTPARRVALAVSTTTSDPTTTTTSPPPATTTTTSTTTTAPPTTTTTVAMAVVPNAVLAARETNEGYAQQVLTQAGFTFDITRVYLHSCYLLSLPGQAPEWNGGEVLAQIPAAGTNAPVGSSVELEVCGPSPP